MKTYNKTKLSKQEKRISLINGSNTAKTKTLLLLLWSITVGQVTYGQVWGNHGTGTIYDNYIINDDKTNHISALRLQTYTDKAWVAFNDGKLNWVYTTSSNLNQDVSGFSPLMTLQPDGRLGIGTKTPQDRLDVKGAIRSSDGTDMVKLRSVDAAGSASDYSEIVWGDNTGDRFRFFFDGYGTSQDKEVMTLFSSGNIGIGTTNPGAYKLAVNGKIRAKEIKVETNGWADYVFNEDYRLPTLEEVEQHIEEKGHLINIPSAKEVEENGIYLGEINKLLLEKIEELTLYTLQQQKQLKKQEEKNHQLEQRLQVLEERSNP